MTGLDPQNDQLLEVACIVTDKDLIAKHEGPDMVVGHNQSVLEQMDEWCRSHHRASGLWQSVLDSNLNVTQVEDAIIAFLEGLDKDKRNWVLAGNSVHHDKAFLQRWMPKLMSYCHYRILDVSSIAMIMNGWYDCGTYEKKQTHRALDDINESIGQLAFYQAFLDEKL